MTLADAIRRALGDAPVTAPPPPPDIDRHRHCRACDVKWHGQPACWVCGKDAGTAWTTN